MNNKRMLKPKQEKQGTSSLSRRTFLAMAALSSTRILGANERIRVGIIGCGGRGQYLMDEFKAVGAELTAVCDVYEPYLEEGLKLASSGAKSYHDYRRLLDDKSIDAVIVATPEHWHAQMLIDTVEAGKDVYVEKPLSHTIEEGVRMVEAVRRTKRVCQVGSQRRSADLFIEARRIMASGTAGEVRLVNSWWINYRDRLEPRQLQGRLDWQKWLGPAPQREMDPMRFFYWQWFFDYSSGMITQASHIVDAINMILGSSYPTAVSCLAGKVDVNGSEVPETVSMTIEYPENFLAVFTVGYKAMRYNGFNDQMKQFHGSKARFDVGRESYVLYPQSNEVEMRPSIDVKKPGSFDAATRAHVRNFLECVRSRTDPTATVEMGHATNVSLCMAVQSMRSGRRLKWNATTNKAEEA
jgi:predicted dehydrogenase